MSKIVKDGAKKANGSHISKTKSSPNVSSKPSTSKREKSTDRKTAKTTKDSTQQIKTKTSKSLGNIQESESTKIVNNTKKSLKPTSVTSTIKSSDVKKPVKTKKLLPKNTSDSVNSPTTRITRTQYFPSKNLFSNALKTKLSETNEYTKIPDQQTTPRKKEWKTDRPVKTVRSSSTLKTTQDEKVVKVKTNKNDSSSEASSVSERPRTATLRKGSIVNENIVGPDVPLPKSKVIVKEKSPSPQNVASSDEYQYEDDFESYESDFEQYSSSSSSKSESSNFTGLDDAESCSSSAEDFSSSKNSSYKADHLKSPQIKTHSLMTFDDERKLDSGNFDLTDFRHKHILEHIKESVEKENSTIANPASLSDEGFEDQKSLQFINFAEAKKKYAHRKSMEIKKKRGQEILNMIRLDTYSFTLFELEPVPYDIFIRSYGKSNTVQTSVQTGDDDISEETQTEDIELVSKWTQFPTRFVEINQDLGNFWEVYKSNYLGVGIDTGINIIDGNSAISNREDDSYILKKFLQRSGGLVLDILREETIKNTDNLNKTNIPFSDGYKEFNTESHEILTNTSVKSVAVFSKNCNKILSVHVKKTQNYDIQSVLCCWDTSDFENPEFFMISYNEVNCVTFANESSDVFVGGLKNGTLSVWNIKQNRKKYDIITQTPCHSTKIGCGHCFEIVSIISVDNDKEDNGLLAVSESRKALSELCSLDEYGKLIFWSLMTRANQISLVETKVVELNQIHPELHGLRCTNLSVNYMNSNYMFIATNYGLILHHLENGVRSNVQMFRPDTRNETNCLETCPFSLNYFLSGSNDGSINLFSKLIELPLMVLSNKDNFETTGIQMVQWSRTKPFVIYATDSKNQIHVWDLSKSDMYPEYSIPFGENTISCMMLSPMVKTGTNEFSGKSYMIIGTKNGKIHWHLLNAEHGPQSFETYEKHISTFLNYVNRL